MPRAAAERALDATLASHTTRYGGVQLVVWNASVTYPGLTLADEDLRWLEAALAASDDPTVVVSHVPFGGASLIGNTVHVVDGVAFLTLHALSERTTTAPDPTGAWATLDITEASLVWDVRGRQPWRIEMPLRRKGRRWIRPSRSDAWPTYGAGARGESGRSAAHAPRSWSLHGTPL